MSMRPAEREPTLEATTYSSAIRTALRRCGLFLRAQQGADCAVGLVLPPDAAIDAYLDGAKRLMNEGALSHFAVTTVNVAARGGAFAENAQATLAKRPAVIVLIEHGAELPLELAVALDRIVEVGPVRPMHLVSAVRELWQSEIPQDAARRICRYSSKLIFGALRRGRPINVVLEKLDATSTARSPDVWEPRVEELEGFGTAKAWAQNLVTDLNDWREGKAAWRDVDTGLLLSGPPGTGKTLFASALARSCGAKFIGTSSARWQAKGHLGDMLAAMRRSFADAARSAPTILFIDEIDAIGDRRSFKGNNVDYSVQVVNALLELLDGSDGREGVIVVAATNLPDKIDPALRRPGRLDRHIQLELPDRAARAQMMSLHLDAKIPPESLKEIALATGGYSGAELAQAAKDARRIARRQGRNVSASDLLAVVPPVVPMTEQERWEACVHESGHAVVGLVLGVADLEMIVVSKEAGHRERSVGHVLWQRQMRRNRSRQSYHDEIGMLLGGMAAEKVFFGDVFDGSGGVEGSDLQRASDLATVMLATLGLGSLHYCDVSTSADLDELRRSDPSLRRRVERLLTAELVRAVAIVTAQRTYVEEIAKTVAERGVLAGREVTDIVEPQRSTFEADPAGRG